MHPKAADKQALSAESASSHQNSQTGFRVSKCCATSLAAEAQPQHQLTQVQQALCVYIIAAHLPAHHPQDTQTHGLLHSDSASSSNRTHAGTGAQQTALECLLYCSLGMASKAPTSLCCQHPHCCCRNIGCCRLRHSAAALAPLLAVGAVPPSVGAVPPSVAAGWWQCCILYQ
jgi:hypothetical protein